MKNVSSIITLLLIFVAGWFAKGAFDRTREKNLAQESAASSSQKNHAASSSSSSPQLSEKQTQALSESRRIANTLHDLLQESDESRMPKVNQALEQTIKVPLTDDLLKAMRKILSDARPNECDYLFSVLENREDIDSRAFMLEAAKTNPDENVRTRALFALEAALGDVFKNVDEAEEALKKWTPDPDRVKLFEGEE